MTVATLDALRDIHLPPLPGLAVALAPEYLALAALLLLAGAVGWGRRWRRRRPLRAALRELAGLADAHARDADNTRLASGLSRLLRRYAVLRFAPAPIAGLSGRAWLDFLDAHGGAGDFAQGVGAVLETRPYQSHGAFDATALMALVRRWLQANPP